MTTLISKIVSSDFGCQGHSARERYKRYCDTVSQLLFDWRKVKFSLWACFEKVLGRTRHNRTSKKKMLVIHGQNCAFHKIWSPTENCPIAFMCKTDVLAGQNSIFQKITLFHEQIIVSFCIIEKCARSTRKTAIIIIIIIKNGAYTRYTQLYS